MPDIFVSYRRTDTSAYAGRIGDHLRQHFGENQVFIDVESIGPGESFRRIVEDNLRTCRIFIALIGANWLVVQETDGTRRLDNPDDHVRREVAIALERQDCRVIPLLVGGATLPCKSDLPRGLHSLCEHNYVNLRDEKFSIDMQAFLGELDTVLGRPWYRCLIFRWVLALALLMLTIVAGAGWYWLSIEEQHSTVTTELYTATKSTDVQEDIKDSVFYSNKPGFARIVHEFGTKGIGPGQIDDARYLTIDSEGNIWTADYQDGRVQQFDVSGKFLQLIQIAPPDRSDNNYITGLTADLKGNLYVSRGGDILKYSIADCRLIATISGEFPGTYYGRLAVDVQNNLYSIHASASDEAVIKLSPDGTLLARWDDIITKINKTDAAMSLDITVDGLGNIYLSSSFGNQVYIYGSEGDFIDRFGLEGDEAGQLSHPGSLAVDGQKHLYIHSFDRIDQFDTSGRFIGRLPIDYRKGVPRAVSVDRKGFVYTVTTKGKVLKYQISKP